METLADWIRQKGPLTPPEAAGWAIRLAKHVESLHEHGVAHGNVSPACILLGTSDPRTPGFMSDVRKTTESIPYHSPERMRGGQLSPADDAWAIAATLYTALTGAPPFVGESDAELKQQVLKGAPAPLAVFGVEDDGLDRVLAAAFNPEPSQRLSNVTQLKQELERWHPDGGNLEPLEDEEIGDEDQAATQMLPMMMDDDFIGGSEAALHKLFAPASYQPDSRPHQTSQSRSGQGRAEMPEPPPPAEQDATVMRALPAHIMAMAARAASGSNPPPPEPTAPAPVVPAPDRAPSFGAAPPSRPEPFGSVPRPGAPTAPATQPHNHAAAMRPALPPMTPPESEGDTTRIAPAPDLAAALRSAQMGELEDRRGPTSPRPAAPRPGFSTPKGPEFSSPLAQEAPKAADPDDVRTVMHAGDQVPGFLQGAPPARPQTFGASPPFAQDGRPGFGPAAPPRMAAQVAQQQQQQQQLDQVVHEDEDDGARTVMREPPMLGNDKPAWSPSLAQQQQVQQPQQPMQFEARWQPAAPPASQGPLSSQPAFARSGPPNPGGMASNQTPYPGQASGISGTHGAVQGNSLMAGGVSAMIQEALEQGPPLHVDPNPSPPQGHSSNALVAAPPNPMLQGMSHPANQGAQQLGGQNNMMPGAFPPPPGGYQASQGMQSNGGEVSPTGYPIGAMLGEPSPKKRSSLGLVIVCLLVLVLAAAVTFLVLKYRAKLGIPLHF